MNEQKILKYMLASIPKILSAPNFFVNVILIYLQSQVFVFCHFFEGFIITP
jgi:hypothetical protein